MPINELVAYHGTNSDFNKFNLSKFQRGDYGYGIYFTLDKSYASDYGNVKAYEIPDEEYLLDDEYSWRYQPKHIQQCLQEIVDDLEEEDGEKLCEIINRDYANDGEAIYNFLTDILGGQQKASRYLDEMGIKGLYSLKGNCIVIFNPNEITLKESYMIKENKELADINTTNFKKWFGNSVTIDENGNPMIFYHGTRQTFDRFKAKYDDKLLFFAYDEQFAKNWAETASLTQEQQDIQDKLYDEKQRPFNNALYKKMQNQYNTEDLWKNDDYMKELNTRTKRYKDRIEKQAGIDPKVMRVYIKAEKIFIPQRDYEQVLDEIIKYYDFDIDGADKWNLDRIKKGAWIYFEHKPIIDKIFDELGYDAIQLSESEGKPTTLAIREGTDQIKSIYNNGQFSNSTNIYEKLSEKLDKLINELS
jgi:hypothetical protein